MKRYFLFLLPLFLLFSACKYQPPCYSIAVTINTDEYTIRNKHWNHIKTKVNAEISGCYFWIPFDPKDPSIKDVVSTNDNIITITSIDYNNQTFTALAKQPGEAKIRVIINDNSFSSSLLFIVSN